MAENNLSLFEPMVLAGVVEKLPTPPALTLLNRLPKNPHPFPIVEWDVIRGSRQVAKPNVPNSEAHIVPKAGVSHETASFIYLREKKVFEPTTLHWLRQPGTLSNLARAEEAVLREVRDLNNRFDNFIEWSCWQALSGSIVLDYPDVQATVDYQFASSHKPVVTTSWATATPQQIIADVTAWKTLITRDGRVAPREAYLTSTALARVFTSFAAGSATLLSDRAKDQYYSSGTLPGFLQIDWNTVDSMYDDDSGNPIGFLPDDKIVFGNLSDGRPMEIFEGPTADDEAPVGFTGRFAKTWKEKDPSARQYLLEYHFLPVITKPEQVVYADVIIP